MYFIMNRTSQKGQKYSLIDVNELVHLASGPAHPKENAIGHKCFIDGEREDYRNTGFIAKCERVTDGSPRATA